MPGEYSGRGGQGCTPWNTAQYMFVVGLADCGKLLICLLHECMGTRSCDIILLDGLLGSGISNNMNQGCRVTVSW